MKFNRYDYYIVAIISLLICGGYGGALLPIRIVAALCIPFIILSFVNSPALFKKYSNILVFMGFWVGYIILSVLWTSDQSQALKEIGYYIVHFSIFLLICVLSTKATNPVKSIIYGWVTLFLLTLPIALREIITDTHLSIAFQEADSKVYIGGIEFKKRFASVTYGNYNSYVTVLCQSMPFLFSFSFLSQKFRHRILFWVLICSMSYILMINASRGGLIALLLCFTVFIFTARRQRVLSFFELWFIIISISVGISYFFMEVIFLLMARFEGGAASGSDFSDDPRARILSNCIEIIKYSYGMGRGAGSLTRSLEEISTSDVPNAHNLWFEQLTQYGFLLFTMFAMFILRTFRRLIGSQNRVVKEIGIIAIVGIIPLSIIDSNYLLTPQLWVFLSSLYAISKLEIQPQ